MEVSLLQIINTKKLTKPKNLEAENETKRTCNS